jgi:hypothetical protein
MKDECKGKVRYISKYKADKALDWLWRQTRSQVEVRPCRSYKCKKCAFWHLTSKPDLKLTGRPKALPKEEAPQLD